MGTIADHLTRATRTAALAVALAGVPLVATQAQQVSISPSIAAPDASGLVHFSVQVDAIADPGLTSFALTLEFAGDSVVLVDGPATIAKDSNQVTCSVGLAAGPAGATDLGTEVEISSGLSAAFLASQGTGALFSLANGLSGPNTASYVFGIGGTTVPATGPLALIDLYCAVGTAVPQGAAATVIPGLYPPETAALFLAGQGQGTANAFAAGAIAIDNTAPIAADDEAATPEDTPVTIAVLGNDDDANPGDTLNIVNLTTPSFGTAVVVGDAVLYTPNLNFNGVDQFTYRASDGADLSTPATVTVTVTPVNDAPVLAAIGAQQVDEGASLTVPLSANDPDGDGLSFSAAGLPAFASLTDNGDGTGFLTFAPGFEDAGSYPITVTVADTGVPGLDDEETYTLTVNNVNRAPELAAVGAQQVDEGASLTVLLSASDPDGDGLSFSATGLPPFASLTDNGDGSGSLTITPGFDDAGSYPITVTVADNGVPGLDDQETFTLTVDNVNRAPELAAIGAQEVDAGASLTVPLSATDPDGDTLVFSTSGLPAFAGLTDNGDGTGSLTFTPALADAGTYPITVTVADNGVPNLEDQESFTLTVNGVNRAPVLAAIGAQQVDEGASLTVPLSATDPDGNGLAFAASGLPAFASLIDNGDGTGDLTITPGFDDAGSYPITVTVADNGVPSLDDQETFTLTVDNINRAPLVAAIPATTIDENGGPVQLPVSASDADGDTLTLQAFNLPIFGAFADNGDGTGVLTFTPGFEDAGTYLITVEASDGIVADGETLELTVRQVNRPPVLDAIGSQTAQEGVLLSFAVQASDPDAGDTLALAASNVPTCASFVDNGGGAATFTWTPTAGQGGNFLVLFTVTDDGVPVLSDFEEVLVTVGAINRPPAFAALGPQQVNVGDPLSFVVQASDPDAGDTLTLGHSPLPVSANFFDNGDGTGSFNWTPVAGQDGNYQVTFTATDNGTPILSDTLVVDISVGDVNRPPRIGPLGNQNGLEGQLFEFLITATDPDGDTITFFMTGLPAGASFVHDGLGAARFSWTAGFSEAGTYPLLIQAVDDGVPSESDFVAIDLTIGNVNRAPILAFIGPRQATAGQPLQVPLSASDLDGDAMAFSASAGDPALTTAQIVDNGNGTAMFSWTPPASGLFAVTVEVTDGGIPNLSDGEVVEIQVGPAGDPPAAPTGLIGRARGTAVYLSWNTSATATSYAVHRRLPGEAAFAAVGGTAVGAYIDTVPSQGIQVQYFVRAVNAAGTADSAVISVFVR